jgi:DNA-binding winged helix-turn-helix (wHTH) protein/tetratricopeptide (TPR) repeat protein
LDVKDFPPFRLDPINQCLLRLDTDGNEQRIELKPKTFDVLRYLVDNPGRLITHDELLEEVWPDAEVQQEVLKSHVLAIRKALGDTAEQPLYILTLRKRGYQFIAPVRFDEVSGKHTRVRLGKFVDRARPLSELREALRLARSGGPQLVFVTGEPGIGKTELVERFLEEIGSDEATSVTIGRCIEGYGGIEPHYPVLEALASLTRQRNGDAVVQALKEIAPTWALQLPGLLSGQTRVYLQQQIAASSRDRMVREFCQLIDKLGCRRTLVLVLEDLHWSDYSTVDLLSAFARRSSSARVMVIATYRLEDAAADDHPVRSLSRELLAHKIGTRLSLPPLRPAAVTEFVASTVTGAGAQQLAQLITEQAGGNPLLMIATLENFIERGLIASGVDGFRLCVPVAELNVEISSDLSQVLESRISQLDEREQSALTAASVVGVAFDAATAAPDCGMTAIEFEEVCETLIRNDKCISRAQLQRYPDGTVVREYTFKHVLYRRALYERQGPIRLAHSHRAICETLARLYPAEARQEIALQLLEHLAGCGEWQKALECLRDGLIIVRTRFGYRDGIALFKLGAELARHLPQAERAAIELEMLEGKAGIYTAIRDSQAFASYEELAALARARGLVDVLARALIGMTYTTGWRDNAQCRALLQEALQTSEAQSNPVMRARTELSAYMGLLFLDGWDDDYAARCASALQVLKSGPDKLDAAWALVEHSQLDMVASRYRAAYRAVRDDFRTLIDTEVIRPGMNAARMYYTACLVAPWALFFLGELGPAFKELEASIPVMRSNGNDYSARILQLVRGWFRAYVRDYEGAHDDCLAAAADDASDVVPLPALDTHEYRMYLVVRGAAEAGLGNFERAHELFEERDRLAAEAPVSLDWYWRLIAEYETVNLWLAAADPARAEAHARLLLKLTLQTSERTFQALAWNALAEAEIMHGKPDAALESTERALAVSNEYETHLATWRVHATAARAHRMLGRVVEAASSRELSARASDRLLSTFPESHPLRDLFAKRIAREERSSE